MSIWIKLRAVPLSQFSSSIEKWKKLASRKWSQKMGVRRGTARSLHLDWLCLHFFKNSWKQSTPYLFIYLFISVLLLKPFYNGPILIKSNVVIWGSYGLSKKAKTERDTIFEYLFDCTKNCQQYYYNEREWDLRSIYQVKQFLSTAVHIYELFHIFIIANIIIVCVKALGYTKQFFLQLFSQFCCDTGYTSSSHICYWTVTINLSYLWVFQAELNFL